MLGFLITQRGIEVDPSKIEAITAMPPPRSEKEVKNERFVWDDTFQNTFEKIKGYLKNPLILMPLRPGVPLILYLTVTENAMGSLLAQENKEKTEVVVYYISKRMICYKFNYTLVEKVCWALAWVTKRLRHSMQAHTIKLVSRLDQIRHLFHKILLSPRLAKWMMMISKYDIEYTVQKSIKGSVVVDFLADQPIEVEDEEKLAFLDDEVMTINPTTWRLLFDGASGKQGYGIEILLINHVGTYNPILVKLE
ncbi:uncharacterized protein LOC124943222 [Impatiens glandulifera]|uniref:uncharacterized protein LOC124943222 n=1 Tax=Impatiens glandulifera TaxID=253017 RepID=UPI001FB0C215|nr:uncharacterized protein LOC124943222 [Impatiens glandulifera]